tara:strand:- start:1102 stop:2667 length:1566 start_codon:yes stop_codon:yes gene_type:complete
MIKTKYLNILILVFFSFFINWYSANIGVLPIDTFGFFDTGYGILKGQLPIRDYWSYTGLTVDYFQSIFFLIFGNTWNSYIIHSSTLNVISVLIFYFFLTHIIKTPKFFSLIYSLSFATLLYPVSGTPFAYLHAYILSLLGLMLFFIFYNTKNYKLLTVIPLIYFLAFFSMQTPTIYVGFVLLIFIIYLILFKKELNLIKFLLLGTLISILFLISYLFFTNTATKDFVNQYFLFPISIADTRIVSDADAYVKLKDQLNFKRLVGDFKLIHFFLVPLIFLIFKKYNKKKNELFYISIVFVFSTILLIYNQLLQANQIYIFSLVPVLCALLHANIATTESRNFTISWLLIIAVIGVSFKYHLRYNIDRKFIDIENVNKKLGFQSKELHKNFNGLKWLTNLKNSEEDKVFLQKTFKILKMENEKSYLITHYQFFSTILDKKFYILNRWYIWDNNSHPTENHKYFSYYKEFATRNFEKNKIKNIYLISERKEFSLNKIKNYFENKCFSSQNLIGDRLIKLSLKNCD